MTSLYESLSPERFQQFCQALVVSSFPNAQCLPVGQPDGGRDAFEWQTAATGAQGRELNVFQIKFGRTATDREETFIEDICKNEGPKVKRLIQKGAKAYYLLTNIQGTAHPEVGTIDRMNAALSDCLGLPAYCWWRDDLDRRVDSNANIKWSYPEIIRGSDLLQALLHGTLGEDARRRNDAIRAYLAAQFDDDKEVKFKQVDLYNSLLDLFIDVPIRRLASHDQHSIPRWMTPTRFVSMHRDEFYVEETTTGAADFLLTASALFEARRIVLEGAPGQGKSTITQYICQTQRMRLLDCSADLQRIPDRHRQGDVRLPFRVDLRDYASWLGGSDPFAADPKATRPGDSNVSLESFLAYQVSHLSGGHSFSVSDISAIAKVSYVLIVLDGFDEVANVQSREQVVTEISKSVTRLETSARALQVIVTSRPAAFARVLRKKLVSLLAGRADNLACQ